LTLEPQQIRHQLEQALASLARARSAELANALRPILFANLDRGRVATFTDGHTGRISEYVRALADRYIALSAFLRELQTQGNSAAWEPLFERMQAWAYNFLLRKGFAATFATQDDALECAMDAALILRDAYFPYDTDFDPWAHVIVQNACRKFMRRGMKKSAIPGEKLVDIEDMLESLADPAPANGDLQNDLAPELEEALSQLAPARSQVIRGIYLDDMSPSEVAGKLGKSVGAIYSLQFNALLDLRKNLTGIRDNLNE
jgi:RNA polymerase sigma factor (sigma-70 family)